ncbi:MAG: OmpA family protein [Deltaproteobacteria bacterium]|nr:OmpA family protein [Deltaproteobacteria bacterium]
MNICIKPQTTISFVMGAVFVLMMILQPTPGASQDRAINTQSFQPSPFMNDLYEVEQPNTMDDWYRWNAGLYLNYQNDPLVIRNNNNGVVRKVVGHQLTADVLLAFSIVEWINVGVVFPMHLYQDGDGFTANDIPKKFSSGDIRLHTKFRVFKSASDRLTLAIAPVVGFPVGRSFDNFSGAEGMTFLPRVLLDVTFNRFDLLFNGGYRFNDNVEVGGVNIADELEVGIGGLFRILPERLSAIAELTVATRAAKPFSVIEETPIEFKSGVRWFVKKWLHLNIGAGLGLTSGYGTPDYRIIAGAAVTRPEETPTCSENAKPIEKRPSEIVDADADEDGIADNEDQCPEEPEDLDGFEDKDGCPDRDNDGDGITDDKDQCSFETEDMDGFDDDDGCPDVDNDQDGIADIDDQCPDSAEDRDAFEDTDGCPDPDNDRDGITDVDDQCPLEPEVINDNRDEDGCPDVEVKIEKGEKIEISGKIHFVFDDTRILEKSYPVLDSLASTLTNHPEILLLKIEGHTDTQGGNWHNEQLSKGRSIAVRDYLISHGVDKKRLQARGFGATRPLVKPEKTDADREQNRRVEFIILKLAPTQ